MKKQAPRQPSDMHKRRGNSQLHPMVWVSTSRKSSPGKCQLLPWSGHETTGTNPEAGRVE